MSQRIMHAAHRYDHTGLDELLPNAGNYGNIEAAWPMESSAPVVWFTGLSGSGKTTLCAALAETLRMRGMLVHVLDGDELRRTVCGDLGFSRADREENVRRMAELARMLAANGVTVLVAAITPYLAMRQGLRKTLDSYVEVYVNAPLATCVARDPKGLYQRASIGEVRQFTGISDPYEEPDSPEIECLTDHTGVDLTLSRLIGALDGVLAKRAQALTRHEEAQHVSA